MNKRYYLIIGTIVLALLIIGVAVYYYLFQLNRGADTATSSASTYVTHSEIMQTLGANPEFTQARQLLQNGQYDASLAIALKILPTFTNAREIFEVEGIIAKDYVNVGNYQDAILYYKQQSILAGDSGSARTRAYAIERLADMRYVFPQFGSDLTDKIFTDDPYAALRVEGDDEQSYLHLYQYAVSIYPIAESEFQIAYYYAKGLLNSKKVATSSPDYLSDDQRASYLSLIKQSFSASGNDITRMRADTLIGDDLAVTLMSKAVALGALNIYGDTSLGNADQGFKDALDAWQPNTTEGDWQTRYFYALYLAAQYGESRSADMEAVISPIYTYKNPVLISYFKNARSSETHARARNLARLVPGFKVYLKSLGWTDADFKLNATSSQSISFVE